jgi:hypothetical protein
LAVVTAASAADLRSFSTWTEYEGGADSSQCSSLKQIDKSNVSQLRPAWSYSAGERGNYNFGPIVVSAKRPDTAFLFFTDGLTWKQRKSDLRKIVEFQNNGDITRIYTYAMAAQFEKDLRQLKAEYKL